MSDTTTMTFSYTWSDAEQTALKREDTDGNVAFVPTDPANRDYIEFLASGATAADYVNPGYKDLSTAKATKTTELNNESKAQLTSSNWIVMDAFETGGTVPAEWETYRQGVRDELNTCIARVDGATTIEEVQAVTPVWPAEPVS